ncbi:unnamed protein product [Cunninghamella blakesleeana]
MYIPLKHPITWISVLSCMMTMTKGQQLSARAQQLNMTNTYSIPIPNESNTDASRYALQNWNLTTSNSFYGSNDIFSFRIVYPAGSYAPVGAKTNQGSAGGAEFFSQPPAGQSFDSLYLKYDLAFDNSFQWVQGGKLPGLFGGPPGTGCSGGNGADGKNCFSMRLMWRQNGAGEAYGYLPGNGGGLCGQSNVLCNEKYGTSISRGMIVFTQNKWTTLEMYVKLNDASKNNGILTVWQDGNIVINHQDIQYRTSNLIGATSVFFSTFFGGGDPSWSTPVDTYTYFKNMEFSVGHAIELSDSAAMMIKPTSMFVFVLSAILLYLF